MATDETDRTGGAFAMRGDRAIETAEEDGLGRAAFAKAIAAQIADSPALDSYVIAITGPWGTGKTSLLNLIAEGLSATPDVAVVRFNPWIFSGAEQLVAHFFREIGAQVAEGSGQKLAAVGEKLQRYGGMFSSVTALVPGLGAAGKAAGAAVEAVGAAIAVAPSIEAQRELLRATLLKQDKRIVVLIDDIDRLRREEVREVVKLVRLTGDFPNVVYVLAYDRRRVEAALGDDGETGRAYMEKIVQAAYDVPRPLEQDIQRLLLDEIERATTGIEHGPFSKRDWPNVFIKSIRPLVQTPRDVRRYVNVLPPTLRVIGVEVGLVDVLALEAIRTFCPDAFAIIADSVDALTSTRSRGDGEHGKQAVDRIIDAAGHHRAAISEAVEWLFPFATHHLRGSSYGADWEPKFAKDRRVAAEEPLRFYLERRLPDGVVAASVLDRVVATLGDREVLTEILDQLSPEKLEDVMGRLEAYEKEVQAAHLEPALGAFLDQFGRLRHGKRHMFDLGADLAVGRIVLRLLRPMPQRERPAAVARLVQNVRSCSGAAELLRTAKGHTLLQEEDLKPLEGALLDRLVRATPAMLRGERSLGRLLATAQDVGALTEPLIEVFLRDDMLVGRLLASFVEVKSRQGFGDVMAVHEHTLPWDRLTKRFGDERLRAAVVRSRTALSDHEVDADVADALTLAANYASGWRPNEGEEDGEDEEDEDWA